MDKKRGERIRQLRSQELGFASQREFAEALTKASPSLPELTRGAVGNWELGKDIGIDNARRIVSFAASRDLTISIDWIYQGAGNPKPALDGGDTEDAAAPAQRSQFAEVSALAAALNEADAKALYEQLSARISSATPAKSPRGQPRKPAAKAR